MQQEREPPGQSAAAGGGAAMATRAGVLGDQASKSCGESMSRESRHDAVTDAADLIALNVDTPVARRLNQPVMMRPRDGVVLQTGTPESRSCARHSCACTAVAPVLMCIPSTIADVIRRTELPVPPGQNESAHCWPIIRRALGVGQRLLTWYRARIVASKIETSQIGTRP